MSNTHLILGTVYNEATSLARICVHACLDKMSSYAAGSYNDDRALDKPDVAGRDMC